MAKIITHYFGRDNKLKRFIRFYKSFDPFTRSFLIVMAFLIIMTPTIITTRMIFKNHAAEKFYIASTGAGTNSVFAMTEVEPSDVTDSSATIRWKTSAPSRTEITFWEDNLVSYVLSYFFKKTVTTYTFETDHEVNLSEYLKPNTTYKYILVATTKTNDIFTSPTYSFKTAE